MNELSHEYSNRMDTPEPLNLELISEVLAVEAETAQEAGTIAYMAHAFVQATMPHSKIDSNKFTRKNGRYTLTMVATSEAGLPYGTIPRLLLIWITSEAIKTQNRELVLGDSLSEFMRKLDMTPTGGGWGSISRIKEQVYRLLSSVIHCDYLDVNPGGIGLSRESCQQHFKTDPFWL